MNSCYHLHSLLSLFNDFVAHAWGLAKRDFFVAQSCEFIESEQGGVRSGDEVTSPLDCDEVKTLFLANLGSLALTIGAVEVQLEDFCCDISIFPL